jgi:hypothetical protein
MAAWVYLPQVFAEDLVLKEKALTRVPDEGFIVDLRRVDQAASGIPSGSALAMN